MIDDLASGKPTDRLICGDVGFGKTEVALRAAFVACMSMFGFWGVFFSIPIATFIKAVWNAWPSSAEQLR